MGNIHPTGLTSKAQAVAERHSIVLEVDRFDSAGSDPGTLMDLLEVLQKAGYSAVDLRDPVVQVLTPLTEWTTSATEAGIVDLLCFKDSDAELPTGYNVSYLAARRVLKERDLDVKDQSVLLSADPVAAQGVSAALMHLGAEVRTATDSPTGEIEKTLDFRHGGGIGFEPLKSEGSDSTTDEVLRRLFWAERLRQIVRVSNGPDLPFSFSRELSESESAGDDS